MTRIATFRCKGEQVIEVLLDETDICDIPWEILKDPNKKVQVGAYGIKTGDDKHVRLPTVWINLEDISEGVLYGIPEREPTPDLTEQLISIVKQVPRPMTADELRQILTEGSDSNERRR